LDAREDSCCRCPGAFSTRTGTTAARRGRTFAEPLAVSFAEPLTLSQSVSVSQPVAVAESVAFTFAEPVARAEPGHPGRQQ
jgi:hypothetical protein